MQEDPIFDAIFVLCRAAEDEGFVAVADALELVLDVYLMEREQMNPPDPIFVSKRAAALRDRIAFETDRVLDTEIASHRANWSMSNFPLASIGGR